MKSDVSRRAQTRRAILDALAAVITETGGLGFSVQQVAERAGVTHRTVYNHFPTRDALNDALAEHVEDVMGRGGYRQPAPDVGGCLGAGDCRRLRGISGA